MWGPLVDDRATGTDNLARIQITECGFGAESASGYTLISLRSILTPSRASGRKPTLPSRVVSFLATRFVHTINTNSLQA